MLCHPNESHCMEASCNATLVYWHSCNMLSPYLFTDFLFFWGIVFLVSTTLVAILKKENNQKHPKKKQREETQGVMETYKLLFSIVKMPTVFTFCSLLLTAKVLCLKLTKLKSSRSSTFIVQLCYCVMCMWSIYH